MDTLLKDVYDVLTNSTENEQSLQDKLIKYQNTYRLESKTPFNKNKAMAAVKKEIKKHFNDETRFDEAARISSSMSLSIRDRIYDMNFER